MLKYALNSVYVYFLLPAYTALFLLLLFFRVPQALEAGLFSYFLIITLPVLLYGVLSSSDLAISNSYNLLWYSSTHRFIILAFCVVILLCGPLDIYINGFKLTDPGSYFEFHGIGRYIRHFTILVWIFIPVAMLYLKNPWIKTFFIGYALLFPILIIDRNRLFIAFYTLFFCTILKNNMLKKDSSLVKNKWLFYAIPIICILIFAAIGHFRSGNEFFVPSSETLVEHGALKTHLVAGGIPNHLPLKAHFYYLPAIFQQVILYVTTPIFNFSTIVASHFTNPDFLLSQLSPFSRENFPVHPDAPIFVPRFNVGTEFYPFLLYQGLPMVAAAYLLMLLSFLLTCNLFKKWPNIFTLLLFIKISFVIVFMGFGPQFFILLNLMFFVLMMCLWMSAGILTALTEFVRERKGLLRGTN